MQLTRPAPVRDPRGFGRGPVRVLALPTASAAAIGDDLKLFATTFLVGFVFTSVLLV